MKRIAAFVFLWLMAGQTIAQLGLRGEYYTGTNFDQKVLTRIDPQINFNWLDRSPCPGLPKSYYSVRWTGKLLAPATGRYDFFAKVDDGIRIWVGDKKVMDSWQLNDSRKFTGSVILVEGRYYDLRVDYFNDMLEGEIQLFWQRPDTKKNSFTDEFGTPGDPITAEYFFQKRPPAAVSKPPTTPVAKTPVVASSTPPKALAKKSPTIVKAKSVPSPPRPKQTAPADTTTESSVPIRKPVDEPQSEIKPGATFILRKVQFEQSSYILLPESSAELDNVVRVMKANPHWHINIAGHTDNVGDPRLNLALSENRAKVVANYLKRRGIADDRITTTGFGGTRPIADNSIETERSKNRRVEITIN